MGGLLIVWFTFHAKSPAGEGRCAQSESKKTFRSGAAFLAPEPTVGARLELRCVGTLEGAQTTQRRRSPKAFTNAETH